MLRWNNVLHDKLELYSLQRFKDKVKKVEKGLECGISLKGYDDPQQGDIIQAIEMQEIERNFDEMVEHRRKHGAKWQTYKQSYHPQTKKGKNK